MIQEIMTKIRKHTSLLLVQAVIIAACLLTDTAANAATYYVATTGSDSNPGTLAQPFRTIRKGTSSLKSGDTLYIRGGTYDELIDLYAVPGGSPGGHTIIAGYGNEDPILRCTTCGQGMSFVLNYPYTTVQDFTIDNINAPVDGKCGDIAANTVFLRMKCLNGSRDGIRISGPNVLVKDSVFKNCGRINPPGDLDTKGTGIHALGDGGDLSFDNLVVEGNIFDGCRGGGIAAHQNPAARNVIIRNNIIRNYGTDSPWPPAPENQYGVGITVGQGKFFYIYNNIIYNGHGRNNTHRASCLLTWGGVTDVFFYNNTCYNNDVGAGLASGTNRITLQNNIWSSVAIDVYNEGASATISNNITNPNVASTFVNAAAGDFRLLAGSPAIGAGVSVSDVKTDFSGVLRPQGVTYDVGAYEYQGGTMRPSAPVSLSVSKP